MAGDTAPSTEITGGCLCGAIRYRVTRPLDKIIMFVMNVWTRSARPWMHIDPAIEQHPQNRPMPQKSR